MGLINKDKSSVSGVPPSYINCALCVFSKKAQQNKISILCCLRFLENSTSLKEAILIKSALYWPMDLVK